MVFIASINIILQHYYSSGIIHKVVPWKISFCKLLSSWYDLNHMHWQLFCNNFSYKEKNLSRIAGQVPWIKWFTSDSTAPSAYLNWFSWKIAMLRDLELWDGWCQSESKYWERKWCSISFTVAVVRGKKM